LRATVQQGSEAEVWQYLRERAESFCNPESRDYADPDASRNASKFSGLVSRGKAQPELRM
jgi:hypothetical protein